MHTVKKNWYRPIVLDFNDWLKDKAEAHERIKLSSGKSETEDSNPSAKVIRMETGAKIFASTTTSQTPAMGDKTENRPTSCFAFEKSTPYGVGRCSAKKRPTNGRNWLQTTNFVFHA